MEHSEWRKCVNWMVKIGFLSQDHELTEETMTLSDLAIFLRDGVALCHLLNKILPGCLDRRKFTPLPESQFSSANNIRAFQDCCSQSFQIPNSYRFDANKFVRMEIIWEVLKYLSLLSKNTQLLTGVTPFSLKVRSYYNFSCNSRETRCTHGYLKMEDDIYTNVMRDEKETNIKKSMKNQLSHCVDELLDTEKNYISVLELINTRFLEPLKTSMNDEHFQMIFSEIKQLLKIHKRFYGELVESTEEDCFLEIADIFIKFKEQFLIYGHYCRKLESVLELLVLKSKDEGFRTRLKECESKLKSKQFKLHEYLIVPMQRVLKYPILLKEMKKQSPIDKVKPLVVALEETQDLAGYVNEVKRDHDILVQIDLLQEKIIGLPQVMLKSFGRTLKDGEIKVKISGASIFKLRHLFLFDMKLIICKPKNGNFHFEELHNTGDMIIHEVQGPPQKVSRLRPKKNYLCQLERGDGLANVFLSSKQKHDLTSWVTSIRAAKDNSCPKHSLQPRLFKLSTFASVQICDVCKKLLKGLFCQGYHCSVDDIFAHKECLFLAQQMDRIPAASACLPKPKKRLSMSCTNLNYINNQVDNQPWFMDAMSRDLAFKLLSLFPESTFLVRKSTTGIDDYCLNIKYSGKIQNIKIYHKEDRYFLSEIKTFHNIVELISFYEAHSLQTVFRQLATHLAHPIKSTHPLQKSTFCKALMNSKEKKCGWLELEEGNVVLLVDRHSSNVWLGFLNGKIGKFSPPMVTIQN